MADDGDPWREAWSKTKARREADAPRREAGRAAFEAVRPLKGRSDVEVRAALIAELASRGIVDVGGEELGVLVAAVNSTHLRLAPPSVRYASSGA